MSLNDYLAIWQDLEEPSASCGRPVDNVCELTFTSVRYYKSTSPIGSY